MTSVSSNSILFDDKKYSKDIQETTHKLVEICNNYVPLKQTTWLPKNYAIKLKNSNNENTDEIGVIFFFSRTFFRILAH